MEKIKLKFEEQINTKSDINEHINTLYEYGKKCDHITEMGVRWVSSTWPLLYSNPKKMISYDILKNPNIDYVLQLSNEYGIDYSFVESDVLTIEIEPTELLFIDTLHTYNQLNSELNIHSDKVSKYIILHDTQTFGVVDEFVYSHASNTLKNLSVTKSGLMNAVNDFLNSEIGKIWEIEKVYENNNGLTILKKKK